MTLRERLSKLAEEWARSGEPRPQSGSAKPYPPSYHLARKEDAATLLAALRASEDAPAPASPRPEEPGREHRLKTWPEPFEEILYGRKKHEIRVNDRDFRVGDTLWLTEYDRNRSQVEAERYTGRWTVQRVTCLTPGGKWGLPPELCVMSIEPVRPSPRAQPEAPEVKP